MRSRYHAEKPYAMAAPLGEARFVSCRNSGDTRTAVQSLLDKLQTYNPSHSDQHQKIVKEERK